MIIKTLFIVSLLLLLTSNYTNAQDENYWEGKVRIINPGPPLNLDDADFAPYISQDGKYLLFTTRRNGNYIYEDTKNFSNDIWLGIKLNPIDSVFNGVLSLTDISISDINTNEYDGPACLSSDKKTLYFTRFRKSNNYGYSDLFSADIHIWDNNINFGNVEIFDSEINANLSETSPSISPDNLRLYFDRHVSGTKTSMYLSSLYNYDIYYSEYDTINQKWKKAKPLNSVNTSGDEMAPYICPDNKTLIFVAKNRRGGFGGLDFYSTVLDSNGDWSEPKNLGTPFNSSANDFFISFNGTGDIAYFTSERDNNQSEKSKADIYMAYLSEPFFKEVRTISWQQFSDANVMIDIYDSSGNPVNTINQGLQKSGRHSFQWDGLDGKGITLPSGVYQYEITIGNEMPEPPRFLRIK